MEAFIVLDCHKRILKPATHCCEAAPENTKETHYRPFVPRFEAAVQR